MILALRARSILKSRAWFQTKLHSTQFSYHYLSLDATIMVSKNCAIVGERVLIIFVAIGYRSNKNTLNCSFRGLLFKNGRVKAWWDATFGKVLKRICTRGPEPPLSCRQSLQCPSPLTDQPLAEYPDCCFLIIQNHFWRVSVGLSVCCKTAQTYKRSADKLGNFNR